MPTTIDDIMAIVRSGPTYDDFIVVTTTDQNGNSLGSEYRRVDNKFRVLVNIFRHDLEVDASLSHAERLAFLHAMNAVSNRRAWLGSTAGLGMDPDAFLARLNAAIASLPTGDEFECYAITRLAIGFDHARWASTYWPLCQTYPGGAAGFVAAYRNPVTNNPSTGRSLPATFYPPRA